MHASAQNLISIALVTAVSLSGCSDSSANTTAANAVPGIAAPSGAKIVHATIDVDAQTYDIQVLPSAAVETRRANVTFGLADYRPTGRWLKPEELADIDVGSVAVKCSNSVAASGGKIPRLSQVAHWTAVADLLRISKY